MTHIILYARKKQKISTPIITKNQIKKMYYIGSLITTIIGTSKIKSMFNQNLLRNHEIQNQITAVIKNDATLDGEVTQLLNSGCDCEDEKTSSWGFPIICSILNVFMIMPLILFGLGSSLGSLGLWLRVIGLIGYVMTIISLHIIYAIINLGTIFDCNWWFIST